MPATRSTIRWRPILGIAWLQLAVVFGFTAYGICQPRLLADHGYGDFVLGLILVQGLFAALIEPGAGALSDRLVKRSGSRLLIVSVGVIAAGLTFASVAAWLRFPMTTGLQRWLLPSLMVIWLAAMSMIRTPTSALLRRFASTTELPQAVAVLTLFSGLVSAAEPVLERVIALLGGSFTFLLGGAVLGGGFFVMKLLGGSPLGPDERDAEPAPTDDRPVSLVRLALLFLIGLTEATALRALIDWLGDRGAPALHVEPLAVRSVVIAVSAVTGLAAGRIASRAGARNVLLAGIALALAALGALQLADAPIVVVLAALLTATGSGCVGATGGAVALTVPPSRWAGLGAGLYAGGVGASVVCAPLFEHFALAESTVAAGAGVAALVLIAALQPVTPK